MPSHASQKLSQSPLCLPLFKFSYATVSAEGVAPIPWIHISGKNRLFAVFETISVQVEDGRFEDRQMFKVLQDPEVMEELDLGVLAAEANRSMTQLSNMMNSAQTPEVAVIVKVPNIAMKYYMTNGQYRRFQMRFASDEDYYEAMKMLSRANVPTVAAGSFPAPPKPHQVAPANQLTPNDSASQRGVSTNAPMAYEQQQNLPKVSNPSAQTSCLPLSAQMSMAPPTFAASALGNAQQRPTGPSSLHGQMWPGLGHRHKPAGSRSHVSLSTATTLVNTREPVAHHNARGRHDADCLLPNTRPQGNSIFANARHESTLDHQSSLGLPPRRTLPFPGVSASDDEVRSPAIPQAKLCSSHLSTADAAGATATSTSNPARNEPVPAPSPKVTGKRKRAAPKSNAKATAAKKPRAPAKGKKRASKPKEDAGPVPTVEELLKRPEQTVTRRLTRAMSIMSTQNDANGNNLPQIPPPTPKPHEPEAPESAIPVDDAGREPSLSLGSPSRRHTLRSASQALPTPQIQRTTSLARPQTTTTEVPANKNTERNLDRDAYPCTPADQLINACTPNSPTVPHVEPVVMPDARTVERPNNAIPQEVLPTDRLDRVSDVDTDKATASITRTDHHHPPRDSQQHDPTNRFQTEPGPEPEVTHGDRGASYFLFTNPTSAQALAEINDWSQLPPLERRNVLRSHLTALIMQPSFRSLCQDLSAMWETEFLMGKLANP
ncbi:hypothetical protein PV08_07687 [Exophiala spinifera]|uniref:Uncharacterized protein n=1 Tax=Exophiala spinifera TaxID=91928 RepID=A0A0D1ZQ20_9EURO|nr:uncharacterized protein PV08_07687 [Exophiala spinifera]KIW14902.1 hypothetical protein PV08_07687 [Exophiala spinifera]